MNSPGLGRATRSIGILNTSIGIVNTRIGDRERCIFPSLRGKGRRRWTDRPGLRPLRDEGERCRVLGDAQLKLIAQELVESIRRNVTIDWTVKENVRARLRVMVKRILRKYGYPPDLQETATQTVIEQAEVICADWAV